jgi:hypothetical protein
VLIIGSLFGSEFIFQHFDQSNAEKFMRDVMSDKAWLPMVVFAIVVFAPLTEELLFRGFMFRGIAESRAGNVNAILLTSAVWAIIHIQYGPANILRIFMMGIILGIARAKSGSTVLCIWLHLAWNLASTVMFLLFAEDVTQNTQEITQSVAAWLYG